MALDLDREPEGDRWEKWIGGVIAPLPLAAWGLYWIITRHAVLRGRGGPTVLEGGGAVAAGLTVLFLALCLHFHYFWGLNESATMRRFHPYGKALALLGLILSLSYTTWSLLRLFIA